MPRTRHQLGDPESVSRPFTGREDGIAAFDGAFEVLAPDRHNVLVYYGVGGIGKTSLIRELRRRLYEERPEVAHARLDFRDSASHRHETALMRLRSTLHSTYGISFPTFDIAFSIYWKLANPHLPLAKSGLTFLDEGEIAGALIGALGDLPVVGAVAKIPRALDKVGRVARKWWTRRGHAELQHIAALDDPTAVTEWLPAFWGADVRAWLEDDVARRVVLFLDTFEALGEGRSQSTRGAPAGDWVRDWAGHLPGVLLVVGGRSKLSWTEHDKTWEGHIEQHLIGGLAPEDCDRFLEAAGVAEDDVGAVVVEQSEGVPLYLDLAVDTYEQIQQGEGRAPRPDEFDENLGELLGRFLHYLNVEERAALYKLSVPETFDQERFKDLMQAFGTGYPATADGLAALRRFSFIEEPEPERYALHALVREALAAQDDPEERKEVHRHLFERASKMLKEVDARAISDRQRRALREGFAHGREIMQAEAFLDWYWKAEEPFAQAAEGRLLLPLREGVLMCAGQALGKEHLRTLLAASYIARLLGSLGRHDEAEPLFRRALGGFEQVLGKEHHHTLVAVNDLANLLMNRALYDEAEALFRRALQGFKRTLGERHCDTLSSINNLARLLESLGRYKEAEPLFRKALQGFKQVLGEEHRATLTCMNNLANLLESRGRYDEVEPLLRQALEGFEHTLGEEHPYTLTSVNSLAHLLRRRGRYDEAELLFRRALDGRKLVLGQEHRDTLTSVNNLANLLYDFGRYEEAEALHRKALNGRKRVLGEEHVNTLTSMNNLAHVLRMLGRYDDAELHCRQALAGREQILGEEHPDTLTCVNNLANLLGSLGHYDEAESRFLRALEGRERALGEEHPNTLASANDLANLLKKRGHYGEAEQLFRRALEGFVRVLGKEHPHTRTTRKNLE